MSPCNFCFNDRYCVEETATHALQRLSLGGRKWGHLALAMLRSTDLTLLWVLTVKIKPLHLKRPLFFVCSVNFLTRPLFRPCKRPDSFSKNTAIRWGLLQGCVWVWNATPLHAALCGSDSNHLCCQHGFCKPVHLYNLLTEAIQGGGQSGPVSFFLLSYGFIFRL